MRETVGENLAKLHEKNLLNLFWLRYPPNRQGSVQKQQPWVVFYFRLGKELFSQDFIRLWDNKQKFWPERLQLSKKWGQNGRCLADEKVEAGAKVSFSIIFSYTFGRMVPEGQISPTKVWIYGWGEGERSSGIDGWLYGSGGAGKVLLLGGWIDDRKLYP